MSQIYDINKRQLLLVVFVPVFLAIFYVNVFMDEPNVSTLERARNATLSGNPEDAKRIFESLLTEKPYDVDLHRNKVRAHLASRHFEEDEIEEEYLALSKSESPLESDIGLYLSGFIKYMQGNEEAALRLYLSVKSDSLPYLSNSIGYIYQNLKEYTRAQPYFLKEVLLGHNVSGAYSNLARFYFSSKQFDQLELMLNEDEKSQYVSVRLKRKYYLSTGQYSDYARHGFKLGSYTDKGLFGALITTLVWLLFLKYIDIFEPEKIFLSLKKTFICCWCFFCLVCFLWSRSRFTICLRST